MGKLRVHNIEAQTGTNVDLGAAGDNVTIASDSIQTNLYKDSGGNTIFQSNGSGTLSNVNSGMSGAGPKLITSTTAPAGTSNIEFTSGLGDYDHLMFVFFNIQHSHDDRMLEFQVSTDGGSSYGVAMTTTFFYASQFWSWSTSTALSYENGKDLANSTGYQKLTSSSDNGGTITGSQSAGVMHLFGCASTSYVKQWFARVDNIFYIQGIYENWAGGYVNTTSAVNAINFKPTGNTFKGTIKMYGMA